MKVIHEAFADRRYMDDLSLQSRLIPGAVIQDPVLAANQVHSIVVDKEVTTVSGARKPLHAETVCIHGDTPTAIQIAKTIHQSLLDSNIKIA